MKSNLSWTTYRDSTVVNNCLLRWPRWDISERVVSYERFE